MAYMNFYATKLQNSIGAADSSIVVVTPPSATSGRLTLEPRNAQKREIIRYTGVSGTTLTGVTRGQGGTNAQDHLSGSLVQMNVTAEDIQDLYDAFTNFSASNSDWRTLVTTTTVNTAYEQRHNLMQFSGDQTSILGVGTKLRIPRTGTVSTQSASFVAASNQYAAKTSPAGIVFTTTFTCEAWVYVESYGNNTPILTRYTTAGDDGFAFEIVLDGRPQLYGAGTDGRAVRSQQSVPLNRWVHIAATLDMSANTGAVYIDGVSVATEMTGAGTSLVQAGDLRVANTGGTSNYFTGKISNARLWSTIRTQQQIIDNMGIELATATNLVANFPLNGSWNDVSGNNNNLTAVAGAVNNFALNPFNAIEYAVIVSKPVFASGNTTARVVTGQAGVIPKTTLGTVSYTNVRAPIGFPSNRELWRIEAIYRRRSQRISMVANTWYTSFDSGGDFVRIYAPQGEWNLGYSAAQKAFRSASSTGLATIGLTDTIAGAALPSIRTIQYHGSNVANVEIIASVYISGRTSVDTSKNYYLTAVNSSGGDVGAAGDYIPTILFAECPYL